MSREGEVWDQEDGHLTLLTLPSHALGSEGQGEEVPITRPRVEKVTDQVNVQVALPPSFPSGASSTGSFSVFRIVVME